MVMPGAQRLLFARVTVSSGESFRFPRTGPVASPHLHGSTGLPRAMEVSNSPLGAMIRQPLATTNNYLPA